MDVEVSYGHNHTILTSIISPIQRSVKFTASGNYDVFSQQEGSVKMGQNLQLNLSQGYFRKGRKWTLSLTE